MTNRSSTKVSAELLEAVKEGDEDASDRLVELLYPQVSRIIRNQVRQAADHQDLAQEVFLKIFLKIGQFEGSQPMEHWVSRVTITTCYDWLRRRRARPLLSYADLSEKEAEIVERTLSGSLTSSSLPERRSLMELLDKLIARLNPREQIVIRLLDLEQHTVKEIGEITGWSHSKIKTIAMRARRKLARHLRGLEGSPPP